MKALMLLALGVFVAQAVSLARWTVATINLEIFSGLCSVQEKQCKTEWLALIKPFMED
jgi:hypothetical protein